VLDSGSASAFPAGTAAGREFLSYPSPNVDAMASWQEIEQDGAEFTAKVKARFEADTRSMIHSAAQGFR
jgi:hypothetical protein